MGWTATDWRGGLTVAIGGRLFRAGIGVGITLSGHVEHHDDHLMGQGRGGLLALRPVYHRLEDRIRAHIFRCWLALLLVPIAEVETGASWRTVAHVMNRLAAITYEGPSGAFTQTTECTPRQQHFLKALGLENPPKLLSAKGSGHPAA